MTMMVELVESPEELNPGDIIIYCSHGNLFTAQIEKKPVRDTRYQEWYKATRCKIPTDSKMITSHKWNGAVKIPIQVPLEYQIFGFEKFEKVKYINFTNKRILRVVK